VYVLKIVVSSFVIFILAFVLSDLLRFTGSDYTFGIFKLFYNTFNISPEKKTYVCSINDFWVSRLKFLARTNYLSLNERLFKINLRESSKCDICDDDIVEDLHHYLNAKPYVVSDKKYSKK
jgi:hypothetical protein